MDFCLGFHIISGDYWGGASSAKAALPSFLGRAALQNASVVCNVVHSVVTECGLRSDGSLRPEHRFAGGVARGVVVNLSQSGVAFVPHFPSHDVMKFSIASGILLTHRRMPR